MRSTFVILAATLSIVASFDPMISDGLEKGDHLLHAISSGNFTAITHNMIDWSVPFLTAMARLMANSMGSSPSSRINKVLSLEYHKALSEVSPDFLVVRDKLDFSRTSSNFEIHERSINALEKNLQNGLQSTNGLLEFQKDYIAIFESDFGDPAAKLYSSLVTESVTSFDLIDFVRNSTGDNRRLVQHFLLGVYQLILESIELEVVYMALMDNVNTVDYIRSTWGNKLENLRNIFVVVDAELRDTWRHKFRNDVEDFETASLSMDNHQYGNHLTNMLNKKYYWRSWLVFLTDRDFGFDIQAMTECPLNTFVTHFNWSRNLVVASVDREAAPFNATEAECILNALPSKTSAFTKKKPLWLLTALLNSITPYEEICQRYPSIITIKDNREFFLSAEKSHILWKTHELTTMFSTEKFRIFLFG